MSDAAAASVEVSATGALASVQDLGRPGWRRFGVPAAGALNPGWLRIANALAGNDEAAAAIEFFIAGPTLLAVDAPVRLGFAGNFPLLLLRDGASTSFDGWCSLTLRPGDSVRAGSPRGGRVGYVALHGLAVPTVLGSASTYARAGLGGIDGRALRVGDRLRVLAVAPQGADRVLRAPPATNNAPIRAVPGPQDDHFDAAALATFFGSEWRVSREADRMGLRLDGTPLQHRPERGAEVVSDAAVPGSVQVPGKGLPIVLLADGGTVGGYPKIATVVSADLPRLACAAVGATLRFAAVSVAEAEALARAAEVELQAVIASITPLGRLGGVDLDAIYLNNLVSGMIDAHDLRD